MRLCVAQKPAAVVIQLADPPQENGRPPVARPYLGRHARGSSSRGGGGNGIPEPQFSSAAAHGDLAALWFSETWILSMASDIITGCQAVRPAALPASRSGY